MSGNTMKTGRLLERTAQSHLGQEDSAVDSLTDQTLLSRLVTFSISSKTRPQSSTQ